MNTFSFTLIWNPGTPANQNKNWVMSFFYRSLKFILAENQTYVRSYA